jgi:hypothetical protein
MKGLGWKEAQRQGDFTNNFSIYTYTGFTCHIYTAIDTYMHNTGSNWCCKSMWFVVLNQLMV